MSKMLEANSGDPHSHVTNPSEISIHRRFPSREIRCGFPQPALANVRAGNSDSNSPSIPDFRVLCRRKFIFVSAEFMAAPTQNAIAQSPAKLSRAGILVIWSTVHINAVKWLQCDLAPDLLRWQVMAPSQTYHLLPLSHHTPRHLPLLSQSSIVPLLQECLYQALFTLASHLLLMRSHLAILLYRRIHSSPWSVPKNACHQASLGLLMGILFFLLVP